jgi:hypothetical protein
MQRCRAIFHLLLIFLFAALTASGQIASSPFSEFGIGDLQNNGNVQNQGMGGIGISNGSSWYINNLNPALLTHNHVTVFQGAMQFEKKTLTDGTNTQSFQNGNLNYLMLAFPVKANRWTTSIGLTPYSNVNYNLSYQDYANGTYQLVNYQDLGKGGLNQFYWANGVRLNKYLSVGARANYVFGSIVTQNYSFNPQATANGGLYTRDSFHGVNFGLGAQFHLDSLFRKNYRLNIGAIGNIGPDMNAQHVTRIQSTSTRGAIIDSLTITNLYGRLTIPFNYGLGISFGKSDRWTAGFDFTMLNYTPESLKLGPIKIEQKFNYVTNDGVQRYIGNTTNGYRAGVGFEITPKTEDFTNYLNRITYRIGGAYEKSPMLVNQNPLIDRGVTFGFSLPVNNISTVDVGVKIGKRGVVSQNMLEENYFRVYFGVTFNDRFWFIKRKFD